MLVMFANKASLLTFNGHRVGMVEGYISDVTSCFTVSNLTKADNKAIDIHNYNYNQMNRC